MTGTPEPTTPNCALPGVPDRTREELTALGQHDPESAMLLVLLDIRDLLTLGRVDLGLVIEGLGQLIEDQRKTSRGDAI